ncbi:very-long-chain 3-oxoacyl-CoA reductase [Osmia lignaria lignaria]|uniref:very-long-chain 3-oxoacyl-CoA reductase n=1 Tax=Osmia lignaria lignaria TaxID=1437193 RepID=UPI0014784DF0|nr:very-long-chain 3-oxoacyl-CoA reductase-like [Osmia lignaria]XP_034192271.1 very-long-chain 3-oxoacyl-CoA reductase-like [Osmia lignaria]
MTLTCWEKLSLVVLAAIGLRILLRLSLILWRQYIGPTLGFGIDPKDQGRWAVITGSTSGIGKAYAEQLARKGMDIVLVSRSLEKLEEVSAEIKERYGVKVRIVDADLTKGQVAYAKVAKAIEELEIGVVVNNAGASYEHPELFTQITEECVAQILQLNVEAITGIAKIVLPKMFERRKGILINISSLLGIMPAPYLTVYGASKAYVVKLSQDLAVEAEPHGVTVQCIVPAMVATKMSKIKKTTWMAPSAEKFVESSLKTIGIELISTGYPPHYLLLASVNVLRSICEKATIWLIAKTMCNVRRRALQGKARQQKKAQQQGSPLAAE